MGIPWKSRYILILDKWQEDVLAAENRNMCICTGRQIGKSTIVSFKAADYAATHEKKSILIVSVTEKQAEEMLLKILIRLDEKYPKVLESRGRKKPTKHKIQLKNKTIIRCEPVGQSGIGILGFTVDLLIVDEAAFMPEAVWQVLTPMLFSTNGKMILISTPNARSGYFYQVFSDNDNDFIKIHKSAEDAVNERPEPNKTEMMEYLKRERKRMSDLEYGRMYEARFLEDFSRLFSDELIKRQLSLKRNGRKDGKMYLGVDVARMGEDESTFEIIRFSKSGHHEQVENIVTRKTLTTQTSEKIIALEKEYHFQKIGVDDGGMGVAVFDALLKEEGIRHKVEALNNAKRSLSMDNRKNKTLLKEDMYLNLLYMLEKNKLKLLDDLDIYASLASVLVEYGEDGKMRIHGDYTHIAEGIIRAAWLIAQEEKSLNLWVYYN